ncbi:hypothetical protein ACEPAI_2577 [Sanghuangporus weigelae]
MSQEFQKVYWIYGFEIDYDVIERIDKERAFFSTYSDYDEFAFDDDCLSDPTERATDFLRREFDCIAPMMGWDPDSPTREKKYVLVVHAHSTPKGAKEKEMVLRRIMRLKKELMPNVKEKAKWYFASNAGVFKGDVNWEGRPRSFNPRRRAKSDAKKDVTT